MQYRQGDLLIVRDDTVEINLPEQKTECGRIVLAYGEVTGHAHVFDSDAVMYAQEVGEGGVLVVNREGKLVHEEHAPINLDKGKYRVIRQREYRRGEIVNVLD